MPDDISRFHRFVGMCDDILSLGKDFAILLLVVLFLFFGGYLRSKLDNLGISELGPIKLKEVVEQNNQAKQAAQQVATIDQKASELQGEIDNIAARNPAVAREIAPLKEQVSQLNGQISTADMHLKSTLLSQQAVLDTVAAQPVQSTGWIYAGQEDEAKQAWYNIGAKNLVSPPATPKFDNGQTYTLANDVYVHNSPPSGNYHTQGDIVAAWQRGAKVQVVDQDVSHARTGGWFIWLKVKLLNQ